MSSKLEKLNDVQFENFVKESKSYNQLSKKCGFGYSTSKLNKKLYKRIQNLKLDTTHFKGKRWAKGLERPECNTNGYDLENLLKEGVRFNGQRLKKKLIKEKDWEDKCSSCGIGPEYNGKPLTLQLDHINGNNTDNRIDNLKILCPNCHSQTDTWCAKIRKKEKFKEVVTIPCYLFNENVNICIHCKTNEVSKKSNRCVDCYRKQSRKVSERPSKKELQKLLETNSYCAVGRMFGVSDNCIRKWLKK